MLNKFSVETLHTCARASVDAAMLIVGGNDRRAARTMLRATVDLYNGPIAAQIVLSLTYMPKTLILRRLMETAADVIAVARANDISIGDLSAMLGEDL